jgi:hypothetical protein
MSALDKANLRAVKERPILSPMKNVLMIVGMFAIGCIVCLAVLVGIFIYEGVKYDSSSKSYVDDNVPAIIDNWTQSELEKRESDQFRKATSEDDLTKLFAIFARLGPLKSYDGATGDANLNFMSSTGLQITARYVVNATFQNGHAEILVTLIEENGQWEILGFRVNSPVLMR